MKKLWKQIEKRPNVKGRKPFVVDSVLRESANKIKLSMSCLHCGTINCKNH